MARRSWVVFVDDNKFLRNSDEWAGKVDPSGDNKEVLSVFFRETHALAYAQEIASRYPGKDIHVYKQYSAFSCQPRPVETKQWTEDGQLLPA